MTLFTANPGEFSHQEQDEKVYERCTDFDNPTSERIRGNEGYVIPELIILANGFER